MKSNKDATYVKKSFVTIKMIIYIYIYIYIYYIYLYIYIYIKKLEIIVIIQEKLEELLIAFVI